MKQRLFYVVIGFIFLISVLLCISMIRNLINDIYIVGSFWTKGLLISGLIISLIIGISSLILGITKYIKSKNKQV